MKIVVHFHPLELIHRSVWRQVRNAFVMVAGAWGVPLDIEETESVAEAERRCDEAMDNREPGPSMSVDDHG